MSTGKHTKEDGSFYTPKTVVDVMCSMVELDETLSARPSRLPSICDPSCGDGAILRVIVEKMLDAGYAVKEIVSSITGCEIDANEAAKCRANLTRTVNAHIKDDISVEDSAWHIYAEDAFDCFEDHDLLGTFDYVIGNPPYIRIHHLAKKPQSKYIEGMCDSFYAFYDLGQQLLNNSGKLCFIAPSSWFSAKAGKKMRADFQGRRLVSKILDFKHAQLFDGATAYTAIVVLAPSIKNDNISICDAVYSPISDADAVEDSTTLSGYTSRCEPAESVWADGLFVPGATQKVRDILAYSGSDFGIFVKNGYATNLDSFFIASKDHDLSECEYTIDIVKASTAQKTRGIHPYDSNGALVPFDEIEKQDSSLADHYRSHKSELLARSNVPESCWHGYGRSQGIEDTQKDKVAVQSLTKDGTLRMISAPAGCGVYGGIYVLGMDENELKEAVGDDSFFVYIKVLGKYKQGGYYAFSGKDLEKYLRWWKAARTGASKNKERS